jgi:LysR family nitrogen assimilation transcriptional regulator
MDLKQLTYFVHVAEMGSFSKAAAALSVAQPALSRQVRNLEQQLGSALLYRNGRGVSLTEAGAAFFRRVKVILDDLDRARQEVGELAGMPGGTVVLGTPPTVSQVMVTPLIKRLRERYPQISLQVHEAFSGFVNEWLASGRLDVAVLYNAPRTRHLQTERLLRETLFLVTAPSRPEAGDGGIELSALEGTPLILPSRPHGLRLLIDERAGDTGVVLNVDFEIDALPAIKELVEDGVGATILPFASVYREVRRGRLVAREIQRPALTRTLVLTTSSQRPLTLAARIVVDELKSVVGELVASGAWQGAS